MYNYRNVESSNNRMFHWLDLEYLDNYLQKKQLENKHHCHHPKCASIKNNEIFHGLRFGQDYRRAATFPLFQMRYIEQPIHKNDIRVN